jgi:hypothetical protein
MLDQNETWTISTSNQNDIPEQATLVFDSTGIVKMNGNDCGTWSGSSSPYALRRNDQDYLLEFSPGTQGGPCTLTCKPQATISFKSLGDSRHQQKKAQQKKGHQKKNGSAAAKGRIPKAEGAGCSWTAQGGTQG